MKMSNEMFERMKKDIDSLLDKHPNASQEYKDAGLSHMRFRWDCYWAIFEPDGWIYKKTREEDLTDDHIDTALRRIVPAWT